MEKFYFKTNLETFTPDDGPTRLTGYATKYNILSANRGGYRDRFVPGVFGDTLNGADGFDVKAFVDHDEDKYLARAANGSLRLESDDDGLKFSLDLPDTQLGNDVAKLVQRGDLNAMSFGYVPAEFEWHDGEDMPIREHTAGTLLEVSVVFDPAFPQTEVVLASMTEPTAEVIESLETWKAEQAGTPRLNLAKRKLALTEIYRNCIDNDIQD